MHSLRCLVTAIASMALACSVSAPLQASIVVADSLNESHPAGTAHFGVGAIGWLYTPSFSYDLVGIETKFSSADLRTITLEVYTEHPSDFGAVLLRSATFTPLSNMFSGAQFPTLALTATEDYFVAFRNVQGLGYNFSHESLTEKLTSWVDRNDSGDFEESAPQNEFRSPILKFYTEEGVAPAPSSITIFAVLIITAAFWTRRNWLAGSDP